LITNLFKTNYNDDSIKNIYFIKWNVEIFLNFLNQILNFACLKEHNENKKTNILLK